MSVDPPEPRPGTSSGHEGHDLVADRARTPGQERPQGRAAATARRVGAGTRVRANWAQLVKFGLVGGSGYLVNLAVFALMIGPLGLHHVAAAVVAFCVAVSNNFFWNRRWTFAGADERSFQGARFLAVSLMALGVNLALLELLVGPVGLAPLPSQAIAVATAMPVNFVGNKLWTFGSVH